VIFFYGMNRMVRFAGMNNVHNLEIMFLQRREKVNIQKNEKTTSRA